MKKFLILGLASVVVSGLFAADGVALYKKCATCHGPKADKKALNKSNPINVMTSDQIKTALEGYKAGTLNTHGQGKMMTMQVKNLSDADIDALSKYIPTIK
ncbi:c-type cytochrome [Helicobacter cholecystus]|uniref:c-type cytochrome n=1 Tax=Helicobacter cholecystus TaxID=45498 RepID=UPI002739236D|nr:c-type cytochrome [Helicobacter cholecystus]